MRAFFPDEYIMRVSNDATVKCSTLPRDEGKSGVEKKQTISECIASVNQMNNKQTNEWMNDKLEQLK